MPHIKRAAVTIALATAMTATAPAAFAETTSIDDERGDAARPFDITSLRVANKDDAVRIRIDFASLNRSRIAEVSAQIDTGKRLGDGLYIQFRRGDAGGWTRKLQEAPMYGEPGDETLPCANLSLDWKPNSAIIRLPRRCMGEHSDRIRGAASVESARSSRGDNAPTAPRLFSDWVNRG